MDVILMQKSVKKYYMYFVINTHLYLKTIFSKLLIWFINIIL